MASWPTVYERHIVLGTANNFSVWTSPKTLEWTASFAWSQSDSLALCVSFEVDHLVPFLIIIYRHVFSLLHPIFLSFDLCFILEHQLDLIGFYSSYNFQNVLQIVPQDLFLFLIECAFSFLSDQEWEVGGRKAFFKIELIGVALVNKITGVSSVWFYIICTLYWVLTIPNLCLPSSSVTSHLSEWLSSINPQMTSVGEDVEKREPLCTVGGNADWCHHCGKKYRVSSRN